MTPQMPTSPDPVSVKPSPEKNQLPNVDVLFVAMKPEVTWNESAFAHGTSAPKARIAIATHFIMASAKDLETCTYFPISGTLHPDIE
jgi:hypothetical protein